MPRLTILRAVLVASIFLSAGSAWAQPGQLTGLGDKCVDVFRSGLDFGTPVVLWDCTGNPNQQWFFRELRNFPIEQFTLYEIVGIGGQCLRLGPVGNSGFSEIEMGPCGTTEAEWGASTLDGQFRLTHDSTQLCLDVFDSSTANGTPLIAFECRDQSNQFFRFLRSDELPAFFVPYVEVDRFNVFGTTTLFAVRNPGDSGVVVRYEYFGNGDGPGAARVTQELFLPARGVRTVDVRNVSGTTNSFGWIGITAIDGATGQALAEQDLYGDYFRIDQLGSFASGDRLISREDAQCETWHSRYFNGGVFDGGTRFNLFVPDLPDGVEQWAARARVYNEQGSFISQFDTVSTNRTTTVIPSFLSEPFGAIEWEFLGGVKGHISAVMTASGRFSVGLETECRD